MSPKGLHDCLALIFLFLLLDLLWVFSQKVIFEGYSLKNFIYLLPNPYERQNLDDWLSGAFAEELLFRLPLALPIFLLGKRNIAFLITFSLELSFIFGLSHIYLYINNHPMLWAVLLPLLRRGIGGFTYCLLFIKFSNRQPVSYIKALAATTLTHFLYNMFVIALPG